MTPCSCETATFLLPDTCILRTPAPILPWRLTSLPCSTPAACIMVITAAKLVQLQRCTQPNHPGTPHGDGAIQNQATQNRAADNHKITKQIYYGNPSHEKWPKAQEGCGFVICVAVQNDTFPHSQAPPASHTPAACLCCIAARPGRTTAAQSHLLWHGCCLLPHSPAPVLEASMIQSMVAAVVLVVMCMMVVNW